MQRPAQPCPKLEVEPKLGRPEPRTTPARIDLPQHKQATAAVAEPPLDARILRRESPSDTALAIHEEKPTPSPAVLSDLENRFQVSGSIRCGQIT